MTVNEGEVRTSIKVLYVKLGAPPKDEWWGARWHNQLYLQRVNVLKKTVQDTLRRIQAAEENKMNVDVSVRCFKGTGGTHFTPDGARKA